MFCGVWFSNDLELEKSIWAGFKGVFSLGVHICMCTHTEAHTPMVPWKSSCFACPTANWRASSLNPSQVICFKVSFEQDPVRIVWSHRIVGQGVCWWIFNFVQDKDELISKTYVFLGTYMRPFLKANTGSSSLLLPFTQTVNKKESNIILIFL